MYKVTRFYSEPQDKTTVQVENQSVDSPNYDYYVRILDGDYREKSDEEVVKTVLDMVRIKLNPNEALISLDEKLRETDDKLKKMDEVISKAEKATSVSQLAFIELTEMVYALLDNMTNIGGDLGVEPEPLPDVEPEPEPEPDIEGEPVDTPEPEKGPVEEPDLGTEPDSEVIDGELDPEPGEGIDTDADTEPEISVDDLPEPPSEPVDNEEVDV